MYAKHSLLTNNLLEQQVYAFVQFSGNTKNWYFCRPIVNISMPPHLDPKVFALSACGDQNGIGDCGVCEL